MQLTLGEIKARRESGKVRTNPDAPALDVDGEDFWANARVRLPTGKTSVHLRLDSDILDWFKAQGAGHLTRMNAVLRSYVEAQIKASEGR